MIQTSLKGIMVRSLVIAAELVGFVFLNSSALLLDALSSLVDVGSSLFLVLCIKIADKPPDEEHPFGHGRFEPIAGLQLGLLLVVLGGGMLFQQLSAILHVPSREAINPFTWVIPFCAVALLEICYRIVRRTAKKQNSPALLADAIHYRLDSINSLFAMFALLLAAYYPTHSVLFDHMGAIGIACLMIGMGLFAARRNAHQLLDRAPDAKYFELVREAAMRVEGVRATEKIRLQIYGPDAHVNIDIEVDPLLNVESAHEITKKVRSEIQKSWPSVRDVIVHLEPYKPEF